VLQPCVVWQPSVSCVVDYEQCLGRADQQPLRSNKSPHLATPIGVVRPIVVRVSGTNAQHIWQLRKRGGSNWQLQVQLAISSGLTKCSTRHEEAVLPAPHRVCMCSQDCTSCLDPGPHYLRTVPTHVSNALLTRAQTRLKPTTESGPTTLYGIRIEGIKIQHPGCTPVAGMVCIPGILVHSRSPGRPPAAATTSTFLLVSGCMAARYAFCHSWYRLSRGCAAAVTTHAIMVCGQSHPQNGSSIACHSILST
jgi:hypothetical protein